MKINAIEIEGFLGARRVHVECLPVTMFVGANGAGKSSIRDAAALALTGDMTRVKLKKDAAALLNEGGTAAFARVETDGKESSFTISKSGKLAHTGMKSPEDYAALPLVLDAQGFARLDDTSRRKFLNDLMGVKMGHEAIFGRLKARLFPDTAPTADELARLERVKPLLRSGFDAASKDAKAKATEAKGAWHATTGETYGAVKAATWAAPAPTGPVPSAVDVNAMQTRIRVVDGTIAGLQTAIGAAQHEVSAHVTEMQRLPELQKQADLLARMQDKLTRDTATFEDAQRVMQAAEALAAGDKPKRVGLVHDLAASLFGVLADATCGNAAVLEAAQANMEAYEKEHGPIVDAAPANAAEIAEAKASLDKVRSAFNLMQSAVNNAKRDLGNAQKAAAEIERINALPVPDKAALKAKQQELEGAKASRTTAQAQLESMVAQNKAASSAAATTANAAALHADVEAWGAIGDALAPDGIPADLLAEALGPINTRLQQSAVDTEWRAVQIASDMQITADGRAYGLLSESEKWRADAMLAEAIAYQSGLKLMVLDRVDVLDTIGRAQLVAWLDALVRADELDTGLLFATMKTMPTNLPSSTAAHWVEAGVCAAVEVAEAA